MHTRSKLVTLLQSLTLMEFENAFHNTEPKQELSPLNSSTNVSFVRIHTKKDPVRLMENFVKIAKGRYIFNDVVPILIQKLTLSNKI